jgi:putative DNA primase/helicase
MSRKIIRQFGFDKTKRVMIMSTGRVEDTVTFPCHDGTRGTMTLPVSIFQDKRRLSATLSDGDAVLPKDKDTLDELLKALHDFVPTKRQTVFSRCGWVDDETIIIGNRVIGKRAKEIVSPWSGKSSFGPCPLGVSGTLEEWRDAIGKIAAYSSILLTVTAIPFAAVLLRALNGQSRMIVLTGPTRRGKSVATLMGASVIGFGATRSMPAWSMKDAKVPELLPAYTDLMMPAEDFKNMKGTPKDKMTRVDDLAYTIASGRDIDRHSSFQGVSGPGEWTAFVVTQGEDKLSKMSALAKTERPGGAKLRCIDLPVLGKGQTHLFDRYPGDPSDPKDPEWRQTLFIGVIRSCEKFHGAAIDAFVGQLMKGMPKAVAGGLAAMDKFHAHVGRDADGDDARDLARTFASIFAGAIVAIRLEIAPWSEELALKAVSTCYWRARRELLDDGMLVIDGLSLVRKYCKSLRVIDLAKVNELDFVDMEGYSSTDRAGQKCHVIRKEAYNDIFSNEAQQKLVTEHLVEHKLIELQQLKNPDGSPRPKSQIIWPDGERRRSVKLYELLR